MTVFPTDDATLVMLAAACEINDDSGRTHLLDFLDMGAKVKESREITSEVFGDDEDAPTVYEVEYEEGAEPFSPQQVIQTLARELLAERERANTLQVGLAKIANYGKCAIDRNAAAAAVEKADA